VKCPRTPPSPTSTRWASRSCLIGLFVYFRRGSAQKAQHFYVFCLASFISLAFHYTGYLDAFDSLILLGNVAAGLIAPRSFCTSA